MTIIKVVQREEWTWVVVSSEKGQSAVVLGLAIQAAAGEIGGEKEVIRTTRSLAEITNRKIDEAEAREVLDFLASEINKNSREIAAEWNDCIKQARCAEIEKQIVESLK